MAARFADAAQRVSTSGVYLLGPETEAFEREFASWLGAPEVVAVSSGAAALQLSLAALGVGPGDEVIVPAFTAVPTAAAVCAVGATPVFVDVEADTAAIDTTAIADSRTPRTKAVIVVHLYGRPASLPQTDLPIIEDAAQAHGAIRDHTRSAAITYSFYPTKNLGGIGDGGAIATSDPELAATVRRLRVHGMTLQYVHEDISQNFRIAEMEAAWLRLGLADLAVHNDRRRAIARHYRDAVPSLRWQLDHPDHVHHLCVARVEDRSTVRDELVEFGVSTGVHYPLAVTQQPAYRHFTRHACEQSEAWAATCMTVPCFPELTDDEVDHVGAALAKAAR